MQLKTRHTYATDFNAAFVPWCEQRSLSPFPAAPTIIGDYIVDCLKRGVASSTIRRRCHAIDHWHRMSGLVPPCSEDKIRALLRTILCNFPSVGRLRLMQEDAAAMISSCGDRPRDARDRALLSLGYACMLRRSKLAALTVGELPELRIKRAASLQPAEAVQEWLVVGCISDGRVFRQVRRDGTVIGTSLSTDSIARIVQRCGAAIGLTNLAADALSLP